MSKSGLAARSNMSVLVKSVQNAREEISSSIGALRHAIATMKDERERVLGTPVTLEAAEARVDEWVDGRVSHFIMVDGYSQLPGNWSKPVLPDDFKQPPRSYLPRESDLLQTLAYYLKDALAEAERKDRLAELDRNILDAEMSEESIIRDAEASGFSIPRRRDADPRAVLASHDALPH
jgi:hypothetical protein